MDRVLLDTSGLFALFDPNDIHHTQALKINKALIQRQPVMILSNFMLAECHAMINKRLSYRRAREFLNSALTDFQIERVTEDDELVAYALLQNSSHQRDLSYFDAVTVAIAKRLTINEIFSFDRHFPLMGLKLVSP